MGEIVLFNFILAGLRVGGCWHVSIFLTWVDAAAVWEYTVCFSPILRGSNVTFGLLQCLSAFIYSAQVPQCSILTIKYNNALKGGDNVYHKVIVFPLCFPNLFKLAQSIVPL